MKYYVITSEQLHTESGLGEYMTKSDGMTEKAARTKFYDTCSAVNKDLSDNGHTFMDIKIVNSIGGIIKKDQLGKYIDTDLEPEG